MTNMQVDLAKEKVENLIDFIKVISGGNTSMEVDLLKKAVEDYKSKRDVKDKLSTEVENLDAEMEMLKSGMSGIEDLIKIKSRIEYEIQKHDELVKQGSRIGSVDNLKKNRLNKIVQLLKSITTVATNFMDKPDMGAKNSMQGTSILAVVVLITFISGFLFLIKNNTLYLTLGLVFFLLNVTLFALVNMFKNDFTVQSSFNYDYSNGDASQIYREFISRFSESENQLFINSAWLQALKKEKEKIDDSIGTRLGGVSIEGSEQKITELQMQKREKQSQLDAFLDNTISADEYLKLRRELDILSLDVDDDAELNQSNEVEVINFQSLDSRLQRLIKGFIDSISGSYSIKVV